MIEEEGKYIRIRLPNRVIDLSKTRLEPELYPRQPWLHGVIDGARATDSHDTALARSAMSCQDLGASSPHTRRAARRRSVSDELDAQSDQALRRRLGVWFR
jgi:hypothetical protein